MTGITARPITRFLARVAKDDDIHAEKGWCTNRDVFVCLQLQSANSRSAHSVGVVVVRGDITRSNRTHEDIRSWWHRLVKLYLDMLKLDEAEDTCQRMLQEATNLPTSHITKRTTRTTMQG